MAKICHVPFRSNDIVPHLWCSRLNVAPRTAACARIPLSIHRRHRGICTLLADTFCIRIWEISSAGHIHACTDRRATDILGERRGWSFSALHQRCMQRDMGQGIAKTMKMCSRKSSVYKRSVWARRCRGDFEALHLSEEQVSLMWDEFCKVSAIMYVGFGSRVAD